MLLLKPRGGGGGSPVLTELAYEFNFTATPSAPKTGTFTPSDNSLLVVLAAGTIGDTGGTASITNTGSLTFTLRANNDNGQYQSWARIWTAPVTTGSAMSVGLGAEASWEETRIQVVEITGYDTGTPVGANHQAGAGNSGRTGAYAGALSAASASDSIVLGAIIGIGPVTAFDVETGWTLLNKDIEPAQSSTGHFSYFEGATADYELSDATVTSGFMGWAAAAVEIQAA